MKKFAIIKKIDLLIEGGINTILGIIGIALPVLPTVPFLLVAAFCFTKCSARLNEKFCQTKFYKKHILPIFEKHKAVKTITENQSNNLNKSCSLDLPTQN
jgi:uncharacterized membrane protein YbaN (DUF454 family)